MLYKKKIYNINFKGKLKRRRNASSVNKTITINMNSKETIKNTLQKNKNLTSTIGIKYAVQKIKLKNNFKGKLKRRSNTSSVNRTITMNMNSKETIKIKYKKKRYRKTDLTSTIGIRQSKYAVQKIKIIIILKEN